MADEKNRKLTVAFILTSVLFPHLKDKFFSDKLYGKLLGLVAAYAEYVKNGGGAVTGQTAEQPKKNLISKTEEVIELLDYFEHLNLIKAIPLLVAKKSLLRLKLAILKEPAPVVVSAPAVSFIPADTDISERENAAPVARNYVRNEKARRAGLGGNKEKILEFIKRSPNIRAKDVIYEFGILSQRTVKRNLRELLLEGLLEKKSRDKAVYYSARN